MVVVFERHSLSTEPDACAALTHAILTEAARQARDLHLDERRVHIVSMTIATDAVALRVRAFGPRAVREQKFRDAGAVYRAVCSAAAV